MKNALSVFGNGKALSPFRAMEQMNRDLGRFFEGQWPEWTPSNALIDAAFEPSVDVFEDKDQIKVKAELPGMSKDDIKVSLENGVLSIQGEKKEEKESKEGGVLRQERSYGSFYRAFSLPAGVDASKAEASYKDGVLELKLPKKEEAKPKSIEIKIGG